MYHGVNFVIIAVGCFLFSLSIHGEDASGLLFRTNQELINSRTTLDLYNGSYRKIDRSFSLSFDISIWDANSFGYIFRLVGENDDEISLVFVNFRSDSCCYIDFNSSGKYLSMPVPISKENLKKGNWLTIYMYFDLIKDEVSIHLQGEIYTCQQVRLTNPDSFRFVFGLHGINLDVASMALRNVLIKIDNQETDSFPLNESDGNTVHTSKGVAKGYVRNPVWLINKHNKWEKIAEVAAICMAGISYNVKSQQVLIVNSDSIGILNMQTNQLIFHKMPEIPFKVISGESIYDSCQNKVYVYTFDDSKIQGPSFAIVDLNVLPLKVSSTNATLDNRLHHHAVFLSEHGEGPYILGGYGKFTYSNRVYKYNPAGSCWDSIPFTGDTICPRFFASVGRGIHSDEMFIYGGFGNQSGKQEQGGRNLYDLYTINLKTRIITKLWEQQRMNELFVPCGNLILNQEKTHFYTLCYPHHVAKTELRLYRFSVEDGSYEAVGSAIPFLSEKIESAVYLFFNEAIQEFIAVTREYVDSEKSTVRTYSLNYPPVNQPELNNDNKWKGLPPAVFVLVIFTGVTCFLFNQFRTRKKDEVDTTLLQNEMPQYVVVKQSEKQAIVNKNALFVLGDFTVYDINGKDITYRFSNKIKALFAVILLSQTRDPAGISTKHLTRHLWQDKEPAAAKNIRGVTINHLRQILNELKGIQLIYSNSKWFFYFESDIYCDYLQLLKIKDRISSDKCELDPINELAELIKRGALFQDVENEWIDDFKQKYESDMENVLYKQFLLSYEQGDFQDAIHFSEALFVIDPLNEEVFFLTIRMLKKMGKVEYSQNIYHTFSSRYKKVMGKDYQVNYSSI